MYDAFDIRTYILYNDLVIDQTVRLSRENWLDTMLRAPAGHLLLINAPHAGIGLLSELAARLALKGSVRVLDGGNRFNIYPVAKALRRRTARMEEALGRITISRAFTCYQLQSLLEETPAEEPPALLVDMLATFLDENVPYGEALRLLSACLPHLRRLAESAMLVISVKPIPSIAASRAPLLARLEAEMDQMWKLEDIPAVCLQPSLLGD